MGKRKFDHISSLPDDVLSRILSLLPTKHAVATTGLSTRWKDVFSLVSNLDFDDSLSNSETTNVVTFTIFVFNVLLAVSRKSTQIRKFRLICKRKTYSTSCIFTWISFALSHNLEELIVHIESLEEPEPVPLELFHCRTLTDLRLHGKFILVVPSDVFLPSLKTLMLSDMYLPDDESVRRFFCGCIALEHLHLTKCVLDLISVLQLSVASLKDLHLVEMNGDYELLLEAPSLEFFYCSSYATRGYSGDILKSLVTATIGIELEDEHFDDEKVSQLINMVQNARSLSLSEDTLEPIKDQTTFQNLTTLWVSTNTAGAWLSLPNVLDNAPCLEALHFDGGLLDEYMNFMDAASCLPERVPACVSTRLKEVTLGCFKGDEDEFKVVDYFLRNAKMLENINVVLDSLRGPKHHFAMTKRLLKLPRRSRACRIEITFW